MYLSSAAISDFVRARGHPGVRKLALLKPGPAGAGATLVPRIVAEPLYLILQAQFLSLPFRDLEVVGRGPALLFFDPAFQGTVLVRQLIEVCV